MDLKFMKHKIEEWEAQKDSCSSIVLCDLLQKLVASGKNNISACEQIVLLRNQNEEKAKNAIFNITQVQKQVADGCMDRYYELTVFQSDKLSQKSKDNFREKLNRIKRDTEKEEQAVQWEVDGLAQEVLEELYENNQMWKKICLDNAETILELYKCSFGMQMFLEKDLFKTYQSFLKKAFDFQDYGQWEAFKNETKNFLLSLHPYTSATAQLVQFINIFDEEKSKENFYGSTDQNILRLEKQLSALLTVERIGNFLLHYCFSVKYEFPTMSDFDYEQLMKSNGPIKPQSPE